MPLFKLKVVETRDYTCEYVVEAESLEEANLMAERGDTVEEDDLSDNFEVTHRTVLAQIGE